ncbi:MAG: response regulator [Campylobacterales bacterium]|nr:response regulator [Campylobacterales bacterium]HEO98166.1 response regulator transcription factor [Campylobacterota bacterium]
MKYINILIVEDESIVAMEIKIYLSKQGYNVMGIASNSNDALSIVTSHKIDIVMMDISIKGNKDGIETALMIKKHHPMMQIIFLTAYNDEHHIDRAIEIDPVAYLTKPFDRKELNVFLKIARHRINKETHTRKFDNEQIILDHEFSYDLANKTLYCCNEIINLTKKENALLTLLIQNKNNLVDFYTIANQIWPDKFTTDNTIRTLIKRLRQKLKYKFIQTVSGEGYRLNLSFI